jgi:hypothetical protein
MQAVNLAGTLARIADFWSPTIVGQVNDFHVKLVKLKGECLIVPHGTEHRPVADEEVHVLLLEPASTVNTGSAGGGRTRHAEWA